MTPRLALDFSSSPLLPDIVSTNSDDLIFNLLTRRALLIDPVIFAPTQGPSKNLANDKPLPPLPTPNVSAPQSIINFLNLLDTLDADVACEVARVRDHITEARALVDALKMDRAKPRPMRPQPDN